LLGKKRHGLFNGAAPKEALNRAGVYRSAVTELSENALDADATRLEVGIADGGCERMLVRDDGSGMSEKDTKLSALRHKKHLIRGCIRHLGFEI
jgi:signal transduction histidine kinase